MPVDDVVDLDEPVRGAAGDAAAAVAAFDDAAGPVRDDVLRTTDREREAVVFEHDRALAVTGAHPGQVLGAPPPVRRRHRAGLGVDVEPGAVPVATVA